MSSPVNIDSRGYGKIYKAVMRNPKLPLLAKTIYAYFCAYAGNTIKAFPKRDKIVRDLKMNKDTYTKHLNTLVAEGYIAKERTAAGNVYTIMQTVPGYDTAAKAPEDTLTDRLVFESVQAKGFGTIPKLVMLDTRLTAQAKAIYAYFASFAGVGTTAFPRRSTVMRELKLSVNTYYDHFNSLIATGYLTAEQHKIDGRFDVCTYRMPDYVETSPSPVPKRTSVSSEKKRHGATDVDGRKNTPSEEADAPTSKKAIHGKNGAEISNNRNNGVPQSPMSENLMHGGKLPKPAPGTSEKTMSEKVISEKTVSQNFGQPYTTNISTKNSYFMTEQGNNHHRPRPRTDGDKLAHSLSVAEVKQRINFERLQSEAASWGSLKEMLGHFSAPADKDGYSRAVHEILDELALQLTVEANRSENPERVFAAVAGDAFSRMVDDLLERWDEIRSAKAYVCASIRNMLKNG